MSGLTAVLVSLGVILAAARLLGKLAVLIRQPQVIGEMTAGILLGPSVLGSCAPGLSAALFPAESRESLYVLGQIGLLLFMFLIGMELDLKKLRLHGRPVAATSLVSIAFPFCLGVLLALFLHPRVPGNAARLAHFALFLGTAMSITAFPVLARILIERKLIDTRLGTMAMASAAVGDVVGWCMLAGLVLLVRAGTVTDLSWPGLAGLVVYIAIMLTAVRRLGKSLAAYYDRKGFVTHNILAAVLFSLLLSAWVTERVGIHASFGAFLMGLVMPKAPALVHALGEKLNDLSMVLLLPVFFVLTGLRADIGLLARSKMWLFFALVVLVAVIGKLGGTAVAARICGIPWREAGALGILLNTRGLMELVLLNVGLDVGVISQSMFTIMVLMALLTTFATAPALEWVYFSRLFPRRGEAAAPLPEASPTGLY